MPTEDELDDAAERLVDTLNRMLLTVNDYLDPPFSVKVTDQLEEDK